MASFINSPYPVFFDTDGTPLENGFIYIGTENQNPVTSPIAVFWDEALTQAAAQPIRTLNGYAARNGTPSQLYTASTNFSMLVRNRKEAQVYYAQDATIGEMFNGYPIPSDDVSFLQAGDYAQSRTAQDKMRDIISVKDFGAQGDGTTDDATAINNALKYANSVNGATIRIPKGIYNLQQTLIVGKNTSFISDTGVTFKRYHTGAFLKNSLDITDTVTDYKGNGNIIIDGGIWDGNSIDFYNSFSHFSIGQGDNIKIKNCTFLNGVRAHAIDLSACRNVWVENNKFLGYSKYKYSPNGYGESDDNLGEKTLTVTLSTTGNQITVTTAGVNAPDNGECIKFSQITGAVGVVVNSWYFVVNSSGTTFNVSATFNGPVVPITASGTGEMKTWIRNYVEAMQLDHNVPGSFSFGALNGTPNINVFFKNNVVGPNPDLTNNTFTSYGVGIGAHGAVLNKYAQNIIVEGNTFTDCIYAGVRAWKWIGLTVANNVFRGCNRCVHVTPTSPSGSDEGQAGRDYTITGNVFDSYSDIGIFFTNPTSFSISNTPFAHERVSITGNTFNNGLSNASCELRWIDGLTVTGNVFSNIYRAFDFSYCKNVVASNNTARDVQLEFIYWEDDSPSSGLTTVQSKNIVISNNQMANLGYSAIHVVGISNFGITGNLIIGTSTFAATRYGIFCHTSSSNGLISENTILDGGAVNKPVNGINVTNTCLNISMSANKSFKPVNNQSLGFERLTQGLTTIEANTQSGTVNVTSSSTASPTVTVTSVPATLIVGATLLGQTVTAISGTTVTLGGNANQTISTATNVAYSVIPRAGLLIKGFDPTQGEIAAPSDQALSFGHFNETTSVFTEGLRMTDSLNLQIPTAGKGLELKSPNSTLYRITVANGGSLSVSPV